MPDELLVLPIIKGDQFLGSIPWNAFPFQLFFEAYLGTP